MPAWLGLATYPPDSYPSTWLSACLFVYLPTLLPTCLSFCLPYYLPVCLCVFFSAYLSTHLSIYMSVCLLSTYLPISAHTQFFTLLWRFLLIKGDPGCPGLGTPLEAVDAVAEWRCPAFPSTVSTEEGACCWETFCSSAANCLGSTPGERWCSAATHPNTHTQTNNSVMNSGMAGLEFIYFWEYH